MVFTLKFNGKSTSCDAHYLLLQKMDERFLKHGKTRDIKAVYELFPDWKDSWFIGYTIELNSLVRIVDESYPTSGDAVFVFKGTKNPKLKMQLDKSTLRHFREANPMNPAILSIKCELEGDTLSLYVPKRDR